MACGNNQVSRQGLLSDPRPLSQPSPAGLGDPSPQRAAAREQQVTRAQQRVVEAKAAIEAATSGRTIQKALADARAALNDARRSGHRARVRELEREVAALTTRAKARSTEVEASDRDAQTARPTPPADDRFAPFVLGVKTAVITTATVIESLVVPSVGLAKSLADPYLVGAQIHATAQTVDSPEARREVTLDLLQGYVTDKAEDEGGNAVSGTQRQKVEEASKRLNRDIDFETLQETTQTVVDDTSAAGHRRLFGRRKRL